MVWTEVNQSVEAPEERLVFGWAWELYYEVGCLSLAESGRNKVIKRETGERACGAMMGREVIQTRRNTKRKDDEAHVEVECSKNSESKTELWVDD